LDGEHNAIALALGDLRYPGMIRIPEGSAPNFKNKSWTIGAEMFHATYVLERVFLRNLRAQMRFAPDVTGKYKNDRSLALCVRDSAEKSQTEEFDIYSHLVGHAQSNAVENLGDILHPNSTKVGARSVWIQYERSDHPFTKRSGDMVYTSVEGTVYHGRTHAVRIAAEGRQPIVFAFAFSFSAPSRVSLTPRYDRTSFAL
jgi:hypothetical protein